MKKPPAGEGMELVKNRLSANYRRSHAALLRKEKKLLETPGRDIQLETAELRGYCRGIKWTISSIEQERQRTELPLVGGRAHS